MLGTIVMAMVQIAAATVTPSSMYSEDAAPGRVVSSQDAIALCATDDEGADRDMKRLAMRAYLPKSRTVAICTAPLEGPARVVRKVSDSCLHGVGAQWCAVEAHAVVINQNGIRRYAVIMVTEDQLD